MSSVFDRFRQSSGQPNMVNIMKAFRQVQQNPSSIGQMLFNAGRIDEKQLKDIQQMNNPRQIGEYLLGNSAPFKQLFDANINQSR